jgi:hypothetical protein
MEEVCGAGSIFFIAELLAAESTTTLLQSDQWRRTL